MKAHSERVKGKNFRTLAGKPLFKWTLDSLLSIEDIDRVIINTDARQLLFESGLRENERVFIRERKPELCGDFVSMNLILADDIAHCPADVYVMTHTTNPLLSADTIRTALTRFREAHYDSLFSVNRVQTRFYHADTRPINHDPNNLVRTQDLEPWFEENSCLYIFTRNSFQSTNARIGRNPLMFETPKIESFDIDTPDDWAIAEAVASYKQHRAS